METNDTNAVDSAKPAPAVSLRLDDVRACGSLALLLVSSYILNAFIFPDVASTFPAGREISTYCGVAFSLVVAVAAYRHPSVLREGAWSGVCLALFAFGLVLLFTGLDTGNSALVALGSPFGGIGSVWFSVLVGLALIKLGAKRSMVVISTAFVLKYAVQFGLALFGGSLPLTIALILYFVATAVSYLLIRPSARSTMAALRTGMSPTVLDATNPSSFLPFSSPVYVSMFLFNAACGFAFASQAGALSQTASLLTFVPVAAVFLIVVAARSPLSADKLYQVSALLVFAGFLVAPLSVIGAGGSLEQYASSVLLYAGSDCFSVLTYFLIAAVGARNLAGALSTSASAFAACWLGIGGGALLAQGVALLGAHSLATALWASALIAFAFMAYNFVVLKRFNFESAIEGVRPTHSTPTAASSEDDGASPNLDSACDAAIERYALTPREGDVLRLLARGRTSPVIQEKLFLSHNTVKTHVRHIYAKMAIHSQQELIDLVEESGRSSTDS